ncbi:MAG: hypothetical protein L0K86_14145 [Actinomycetia bacterium]|nr:hypothetical protein [Actinomycetes bacterium]
MPAQYVRCLVKVFVGNGHGVANAEDVYTSLLRRLDAPSAGAALRTYIDPEISSVLGSNIGGKQWTKLLDILEPKLTSNTDRTLMTAVRSFTGTPDQLMLDTQMKRRASSAET